MNYEQRYNELIDAIKEMMEANPHDEGLQNWVQDNVPELTESEDERIRGAIIDHLKDNNLTEWASWLEKQGESKTSGIWFNTKDTTAPSERDIVGWYKTNGKLEPCPIAVWFCSEEEARKEAEEYNDCFLAYWAELPEQGFEKNYWLGKQGDIAKLNEEEQGGITKLSEEEQNRFAKGILSNCALSFINYLDAHRYEGKMCVSNWKCEDIENAFHNAMWDRLHRYYCKYIEKRENKLQGKSALQAAKEEKVYNANKIKPKFKIEKGKWYVCIQDLLDNYANIAFYKGDTYISTQDGSLIPCNSNVPFEVVCPDTYFRDWTIQDAEDGDVLETQNYIYIFNSIDKETETVSFYCLMKKSDEHFSFGDYKIHDEILNSIPATQEQRITFFTKMKEAGYEWNAKNKILKKIEL